jgi:hypothetical protein
MKILLADSGWKMRGGQWQTLYLAEGLREQGHHVTLLLRHGSLLWDLAHRSKLTAHQVGVTTMLLQGARHDVIHVQDSHSHTVAALSSTRPFLVSRRVAFPVKTTWASQKKYERAAGYLAISSAAARELKRVGIPAEKIRLVPDGVPDIAPAALGTHVAGLKSEDPGKMNLLMSEACTLAGAELRFSDNLADALQSAALFLYLSENEGLGSAALLAMAAGLPVVASRVGGLPEAVDDGFSGLLVPNDKVAVARAIRAILDDRHLALRFSENARRRYLERFTLEHMVRNTLAAYKELLSD